MTVYHYDQAGQLLAETDASGTVQADYLHLDGQPLAKIDATGTSYIHPDHLGTPQLMTDSQGTVVWQIEARPFGDSPTITGTQTLNLRFPGQYYDAESGLHQNWFRDYQPNLGRYVEADPIGLMGGDVNIYVYVSNWPMINYDIMGLSGITKYRYPLVDCNQEEMDYCAAKCSGKGLDTCQGRRQIRVEIRNGRVAPANEVRNLWPPNCNGGGVRSCNDTLAADENCHAERSWRKKSHSFSRSDLSPHLA